MKYDYLKGIEGMNMYDPPLMGIFDYNKKFTAYSLKVLARIDVDDLNSMQVIVEDFLAPVKDGRAMRMDVRINLIGNTRTDIEIQKINNKDELARALYYLGGLLVDYSKGLEVIPQTKCIVVFICNFDPFEGTPYEGMTRMRYTLRSEDDSKKFHTKGGEPYPFDAVNVLIYNGAKKWDEDNPLSEEEEAVRIYLEDMQKVDPKDMKSSIASNAVTEYKGDPVIMDKAKQWVRATYHDEIEEEKRKLQEEYETKLTNKTEEVVKKLIAHGEDDEYINDVTGMSIEMVLEIRSSMQDGEDNPN